MKITLFHSHPRLLVAALSGLTVGCVLHGEILVVTRVLAGWNIAVWIYLASVAWLAGTATPEFLKVIAEQEDRSSFVILILLVTGSTLSLAAIVMEMGHVKDLHGWIRAAHYLLTAATVAGSWLLVSVIFAFHYARLYFSAPDNAVPLAFPDRQLVPGYADFFYFSLNIGAAAQTSDISILGSQMRRVVLAHTLISFLFNAAIIGMAVNIAASVIGG